MKQAVVEGKQIVSFQQKTEGPVFLWGTMKRDKTEYGLDTERSLKSKFGNQSKQGFLLVIYEVEDWFSEFSPWFWEGDKNSRAFGGNGKRTLEWIQKALLVYLEKEYMQKGFGCNGIYLTGYSLAGLFSAWAFYESGEMFQGFISASGSFWYPGWDEYMQSRLSLAGNFSEGDCEGKEAQSSKADSSEKTRIAYLSLGGKEPGSGTALMATIGDSTKRMKKYLDGDTHFSDTVLEWNKGGHFTDPDGRVFKGISFVLDRING